MANAFRVVPGLVADPRPRGRAIRHTWDRVVVVVVVVVNTCDENNTIIIGGPHGGRNLSGRNLTWRMKSQDGGDACRETACRILKQPAEFFLGPSDFDQNFEKEKSLRGANFE